MARGDIRMKRVARISQSLFFCLVLLFPINAVFAQTCVLDSQFPYPDCPFTDEEKKSVRFGSVSGAFVLFDSDELLLRFNHARYILNLGASWVEEDDDDCEVEDVDEESDLFVLRSLINFNSNDIAFMANPDDVREITKVWILDCEVEPDIR